eukprot:Gb_04130 [translate_table: standard]
MGQEDLLLVPNDVLVFPLSCFGNFWVEDEVPSKFLMHQFAFLIKSLIHGPGMGEAVEWEYCLVQEEASLYHQCIYLNVSYAANTCEKHRARYGVFLSPHMSIGYSSNLKQKEVGECMQDCCARVLLFLQKTVIALKHPELHARVFVCLERWIQAGVTLSELFSDYSSLFEALVSGLGSQNESCFQAAASALCEFISLVDHLPSREMAIHAIVAGQRFH